jgi:hypothetical protein
MVEHRPHEAHGHTHGEGCGHQTIEHEGHRDYLHDGHMHFVHEDCVDCHSLAVGDSNQAECQPGHACGEHEASHAHGQDCGHTAVPHGDHTCYVVSGHLHHAHADHCDEHGRVAIG